MTADEEEDIPGTGAVCTFGKSRFAGNLPGMFWVKNDPVIHVACGDEHSVFITAEGRAFSFGSNGYGQLGLGHKNPVTRPKCIKGLKDHRVVLVACGRAHTLVATDDLKVYGFGMNTEHQLGLDSQEFQHTEPALIRSLTGLQIKQLAAGAEHSVALTDKGVAFVWGCGKEGQLGLGTRPSVPEPLELKVDIRIMSVSAGYYHTAIVSVDGILYTFGERDGGKLGLPKTLCCKRYNKPTEVSTIPGKIVSVSCGGTHTMALTAEGKVYAFGDGRNGQLGLGNKTTQSSKPQPIPFPEGIKIARVVCGESHTAFLSEKRQLLTCGDSRHGKLAHPTEDSPTNKFKPTLVEDLLPYQVQQVACGGCHTLVLVVPGAGHDAGVPHGTGAAGDGAPARLKPRQRKQTTMIENDDHDDVDGCEEDARVTARVLGETGRQPKRRPLLLEVEADTTIRHVDSDVSDDDTSEMSVLNKTQIINHIGSKEILSALEHEERPLALKGEAPKPAHKALQNGDKGKLNGPKEEPAVLKASVSETPKKIVTAAVATVTTSDHKTDSEADERHEKVRWLPAYKDSPKHRKELEKAAKKEKEKGTPTKRFGKKKKDGEQEKDGAKGDAKEDETDDAKKDSKSSTCVIM
ncbi:X-linked retinitis pigmentosa GTPase regulator isoform X2 [Ixodes scapularis]|uniref:X-linked retinitis pigmentosa GTPase regulator isoform X2 n=1 Tax=Ixodes scapularis TaxID=6945 RepID=UPI001A9E34D5|nr:X-linked retinitis pigmentosa GTPase regulator isoform X2 [Ixodes scapularis]